MAVEYCILRPVQIRIAGKLAGSHLHSQNSSGYLADGMTLMSKVEVVKIVGN